MFENLKLAGLALFMFLAMTDSPNAQTTKTNDDRRAECVNNLGGKVLEYEGDGFTCTNANKDISIHCTSQGSCICTGGGCDDLGDNGGLGRVGDSKQKIMAKLSPKLNAKDKVRLEKLVAKSLLAIRERDGKTATATIKEVQSMMAKPNTGGGKGNPLYDCGVLCQDILIKGNAPAYAVCYWACVIMGGPGGFKSLQ